MDKTKPISITDAKPSDQIFLSRLQRAELSEAWLLLKAAKTATEDSVRAFQQAKEHWEKQIKSAQHSVGIEFKDWDPKTGQVFTPVNAPQRRDKTGEQ